MSRKALPLLVMLSGCGTQPPERFDVATLSGESGFNRPAAMAAFAPAPGAQPADAAFSGRLVSPEAGEGAVTVEHDALGLARSGALRPAMPDVDVAFVQAGRRLLPAAPGPMPVDGSPWELMLEPGAVWKAPADGGWNRAAIPFALRERNADCTHNGVMTFLFDGDGEVSEIAYQVSSQTCAYLEFTLWGRRPADYVPGTVDGAKPLRRVWRRYFERRLPTRPIDAVAADYPGADPARFGSADEVDPAGLTTYGFVIDGTHYTGPCPTIEGEYPYCDVMSLPSYSLAKSLFAGLALARAERLHPGIGEAPIGKLVPACRATGTWDDVRIADALNMATGHYDSAEAGADEKAMIVSPFFVAEDAATKTACACTAWPRRAEPGTTWVYHTTDVYLAGVALRAALAERLGRDVDLFEELIAMPVWDALGLSPRARYARRTCDADAQPFFGWGLSFYRDDIARIASFLLGLDPGLAPEDVFDPALIRASLQQDSTDRGLDADIPGMKYRNGFRGLDVARYLGCSKPARVSVLSGFGGIILVLMPNETAYYYFSDGYDFRWMAAARESDRIRPYCVRDASSGDPA